MLTTVLQIGSVLRSQPGAKGIRHHRYVKAAPLPRKGQLLHCFEVAVAEDMTFDLSVRREIESEHDLAELFYLNYKTSDADSMKKYIFGDICRYQEKKPTDTFFTETEINFDLGNPNSGAKAFQVNSFERGRLDAESIQQPAILAFRRCLEKQMDALLALFSEEKSIYLNFRFGKERKHWYELDTEVTGINRKLLGQFVTENPGHGYVLSKSLYKTLASGKECAPQFVAEGLYKAWSFSSLEQVADLIYAIDISQSAMMRKGDIKIVVLPRSDDTIGKSSLSALQIEDFLKLRRLGKIAKAEGIMGDTRLPETDEEEEGGDRELTEPYLRARDYESITQFDFIFSKASSSPSTPDVDVVELAGVEKSRIGELHGQIKVIRGSLEDQRNQRFLQKGVTLKKPPSALNVFNSLNNVLNEVGREKKKYSSHLLKVLPQIYCGSYVEDDLLLPAFLETTERKIRDGESNYDFLRFDLLFLWELQETNKGKENTTLKKIQDTNSYKIGQCLGKLARPVAYKINSFQKNYIGLLSRRVAQREDVIVLQNYLDQKLFLHYPGVPKGLRAISRTLTALVNHFPDDESYNREYCVFGFFESYFEPSTKQEIEETFEDDTSMEEQDA